ncbi:DNA repair protein RAD14 [Nakaseomyces bracarensis]|uniref:DNA repair protein RAD14 n=1 Tax=Nakaseomyces bracarensis TaxID=273131 RepID=A0ABR4NXB1_9SACH
MVTPEQKARIEANRKAALQRLQARGIVSSSNSNNSSVKGSSTVQNNTNVESRRKQDDMAALQAAAPPDSLRDAVSSREDLKSKKRPLDHIRPSIRKQDYIEYDFATMKNLNGGYINPEDKTGEGSEDYFDELGSKKQKSLDDWKREQKERRMLYENAPPPEHISKAPKCIECNINIEMDPVLHDVFKLQVCKQCSKDHPEKYALLTKTECKEDYFLTDPELNDLELFHRLEKPNPHSGTFARMQLFVRCQIEEFAFKKWGGEEGLDQEWQKREEGKTSRREKKYQKKIAEMRLKTRAQEYTNRLREQKYGTKHVHDFSIVVTTGKDDDGTPFIRKKCVDCGLETEETDI